MQNHELKSSLSNNWRERLSFNHTSLQLSNFDHVANENEDPLVYVVTFRLKESLNFDYMIIGTSHDTHGGLSTYTTVRTLKSNYSLTRNLLLSLVTVCKFYACKFN